MGSIINAILIAIGTTFGLLFGKHIKQEQSDQIIQAMGLCVIYIGISGMLEMTSAINMLISMALGTLIGSIIDLDEKINKLGLWIENKVKSKSSIAIGFVNASLLFAVGSMAIVGAFEDGLTGNYQILLMKGIIDAISAIILTSKYGIGVYFSSILILIYQGTLTILARFIAGILTPYCITQLSSVGSLVILAVGLNMMKIVRLKPMNMVPAIFVSAILTLVLNI